MFELMIIIEMEPCARLIGDAVRHACADMSMPYDVVAPLMQEFTQSIMLESALHTSREPSLHTLKYLLGSGHSLAVEQLVSSIMPQAFDDAESYRHRHYLHLKTLKSMLNEIVNSTRTETKKIKKRKIDKWLGIVAQQPDIYHRAVIDHFIAHMSETLSTPHTVQHTDTNPEDVHVIPEETQVNDDEQTQVNDDAHTIHLMPEPDEELHTPVLTHVSYPSLSSLMEEVDNEMEVIPLEKKKFKIKDKLVKMKSEIKDRVTDVKTNIKKTKNNIKEIIKDMKPKRAQTERDVEVISAFKQTMHVTDENVVFSIDDLSVPVPHYVISNLHDLYIHKDRSQYDQQFVDDVALLFRRYAHFSHIDAQSYADTIPLYSTPFNTVTTGYFSLFDADAAFGSAGSIFTAQAQIADPEQIYSCVVPHNLYVGEAVSLYLISWLELNSYVRSVITCPYAHSDYIISWSEYHSNVTRTRDGDMITFSFN